MPSSSSSSSSGRRSRKGRGGKNNNKSSSSPKVEEEDEEASSSAEKQTTTSESTKYDTKYFKELQKKTRKQCQQFFTDVFAGSNDSKDGISNILKEYSDSYQEFSLCQKRYKQNICKLHGGKATKDEFQKIQNELNEYIQKDHDRVHILLKKLEPILEKINKNVFDDDDNNKNEEEEASSITTKLFFDALLKCTMITQETPRKLAEYCSGNNNNNNNSDYGSHNEQQLVLELLDSTTLLKEFMIHGGPTNGNFCNAYVIYKELLKLLPTSDSHYYHCEKRLAMAVALEHAKPIEYRLVKGQYVNPILRFQHYQQAHRNGELDPAFGYFTTWEYRFIVDSDAHDDELQWGRTYLRNYRPDQAYCQNRINRYSKTVDTDLTYNPPIKKLSTYQQILSGGGMCGPYAWFGRFINKAHGVPTWGCQQPNHAAYSKWTGGGSNSSGNGKNNNKQKQKQSTTTTTTTSGWTLLYTNTGCDWLQSYCYSGKFASGNLFRIEADGRQSLSFQYNNNSKDNNYENEILFQRVTLFQCMAIISGENIQMAQKVESSPFCHDWFYMSLVHAQFYYLWNNQKSVVPGGANYYNRGGPEYGIADNNFPHTNIHQEVVSRNINIPKDPFKQSIEIVKTDNDNNGCDGGFVVVKIPACSYVQDKGSKAVQNMKSYYDNNDDDGCTGFQVYLKNKNSQLKYKLPNNIIEKLIDGGEESSSSVSHDNNYYYCQLTCKVCTVHEQHQNEFLLFQMIVKKKNNKNKKDEKKKKKKDDEKVDEVQEKVSVPYTIGEWQYTTRIKMKLPLLSHHNCDGGDDNTTTFLKISRIGEKCNKGISIKHILLESC